MEVNTEVWQERARVLLERAGAKNHFVVEIDGVWNACERGLGLDDFPDDCEIERCDAAWSFAFDEWKPTLAIPELAGKDAPSLPLPFKAPELAAFMLYGLGALVADFFGHWEVGPSIQSLNKLPAGQSELRALVKGAYSAYRLAQKRVGNRDDAALIRRDAAHEAYRKSNNDKALLKAFEDAQAEWDAANQAWLTAMVVCLLEKPQASTEAPAPAQTAATPAPVAADSGKKLPAWLDVTGNYIAGIMKDGQILNAKLLYRALEAQAGPESPFDKGTGQNRGSLYVRKIAAPVSLKTMQNNWSKIRSLP